MKEVTVFEVEGKRFDTQKEAFDYEVLCNRVHQVMSLLKPRTKEVEEGIGYMSHDFNVLNTALEQFMGICGEVFPDYKEVFDRVGKKELSVAKAEMMIDLYPYLYPVINKAFYRLLCIDFNSGLEFQRPDYAKHIAKAFEDIKNKKI